VGKDRHAPALAAFQHLDEPVELRLFLRMARPDQQAVEADQTPAADILGEAIGTGKAAPAFEPDIVDRLVRAGHVADVVIAGNDQHRHVEFAEQRHGEDDVVRLVGAVDGEVAGVQDEVGVYLLDPAANGLPVAVEVRLGRAEMRIADLDDFHGLAPSTRDCSRI